LVERVWQADVAGVVGDTRSTDDNAGDESVGAVKTQPTVVVRTTMSGSIASVMR